MDSQSCGGHFDIPWPAITLCCPVGTVTHDPLRILLVGAKRCAKLGISLIDMRFAIKYLNLVNIGSCNYPVRPVAHTPYVKNFKVIWIAGWFEAGLDGVILDFEKVISGI